MNKLSQRAGLGLMGKQTITLRDKNGRTKKLWNDNVIGKFILSILRAISKGKIAMYGIRIPYITGKYSDQLEVKNLITSAGKAGMASRINGSGSEDAFTYLAVGTGTTAAAAGDTTLETEISDSGLERAAATASRQMTSVTNDTARLLKTWTASGSKAVTEVGALNAGSAGVLLGRQVFSAINVTSGDSLQVTYDFIVSAS